VTCLPPTPLKSLGAIVLVRVVLISTVVVNVLLVVHALGFLFCLTLRLLTVEPVLALCFRETIDLSTCIVVQSRAHEVRDINLLTCEASEELLSELVRDGLACKLRQ
jgi:hypothetical protein